MNSKSGLAKVLTHLLVLCITAAAIKIVSQHSGFIEKYYSTFAYSKLSIFLRALTAWLPFSLGDVLYVCAAMYVLIYLVRAFKTGFNQQIFLFGFLKIARCCLWFYIGFNLLWGFNYDRLGITYQLKIEPAEVTTAELAHLTSNLVKSVNASRNAPGMLMAPFQQHKTIFYDAAIAYKNVALRYPFLAYHQPCIKPTLFSGMGNNIGVAGYYNPLTAETQINKSIPYFLLPYIVVHEIAHQIGYANEADANFVGYLAAKAATDNAFRYSAYFTLFNYANSQLFNRDSITALKNYKALDSLVQIDELAYQHFLGNNPSVAGRFITKLYGNYLTANNQPKGINTYNDVIALLVAYQKKYGEL